VAKVYQRYNTYYPQPGQAVQSPNEWWKAVCETTRVILRKAKIPAKEISCVSWSGQMMGCIPVDKKGRLLQDYVMIYVDSRAKGEAKYIMERLGSWQAFYEITGNGLALPNYSISKILWIKNNMKKVYKKADKFLQAKDYLTLRLTSEKVTDFSDASLYGAFDLRKDSWSTEILNAAGIDEDKLPELHESMEIAGYAKKEAATKMGLKEGTPVIVGGGDVLLAAAGAGVFEENATYISSGSSCWAGYFSSRIVLDLKTRISCQRHVVPKKYAPHDYTYSGAVCKDWIKENMFWLEEKLATEIDKNIYEIMDHKAGQIPPGSEGILFLPYMRGGEAPHHNSNMRGTFLGLTFAHTRSHLYRAVNEGIAFNTRAIIENFENVGAKIGDIRMVGGGALSMLWRQIFADILGKKILRLKFIHEANALAAFVVGGIGVGFFKNFDIIKSLNTVESINEPNLQAHEKYNKIYSIFKQSYMRLGPLYDDISLMLEKSH
jgi:xylulokinase